MPLLLLHIWQPVGYYTRFVAAAAGRWRFELHHKSELLLLLLLLLSLVLSPQVRCDMQMKRKGK
jgi:hypothetical protein